MRRYGDRARMAPVPSQARNPIYDIQLIATESERLALRLLEAARLFFVLTHGHPNFFRLTPGFSSTATRPLSDR
jgi:hypothetical protein